MPTSDGEKRGKINDQRNLLGHDPRRSIHPVLCHSHAQRNEQKMKARHWNELNAALWKFVREPLVNEISRDAWFDTLREKHQQGQIEEQHDMRTVRCYTLNYSYMHFDALTKLINEQLKRRLMPLPEHLLHIAFGCGPGTDSWAVIRALGESANVTTIGYDHNGNMIALARNITGRIVRSGPHRYQYFDDRDEFERGLRRGSGQVALVTANALFGQNTVADEFIAWLVDLIDWLADRKTQVFVLGTHPDYDPGKVNQAWEQIAEIQGANELYENSLDIRPTWSATNFGKYHWSEAKPWQRGDNFGEQLARIIRVQR